jgi:hypothetical protein
MANCHLLGYAPVMLLAALIALVSKHHRCGELDGGVDGARVWMSCECGAEIVQSTASRE